MPDAPLTTLCAICHTTAPKYTCPACHTPTCSLPCAQRHKAWASCTGRRDPTAFVPAAALKTPAGVDHDYNFLAAIERARARTQRELVDERGLFGAAALGRDLDGERAWRREWFGEEVRFVKSNTGGGRRGSGGDEDGEGRSKATAHHVQLVRRRMAQLDVEVVRVPEGMQRGRENKTAWNRKAKRINWTVEWFLYDQKPTASSNVDDNDDRGKQEGTQQQPQQQQPLRIRHTALETTPLYRAFGTSLAYRRRLAHNPDDDDHHDPTDPTAPLSPQRRRVLIKEVKADARRSTPQDAATTAFAHATPYPIQNPYTGAWAPDRAATTTSWAADDEIETRRRGGWRFYLLRHHVPGTRPAAAAKELVPVPSGEHVGRALRGCTVLEFPTFYVLPPPAAGAAGEDAEWLPEGCVLGSTERRKPKKASKKRKADDGDNNARGPAKAPLRRGRGKGKGRGGRGGRSVRFVEVPRRPRGEEEEEEEEVEEGEIVSGEDEQVSRPTARGQRQPQRQPRREAEAGATAVDTSRTLDADTSSDDSDEEEATSHGMMEVDDDDDSNDDTAPDDMEVDDQDDGGDGAPPPKPSLGLVDYGSDSDWDEGEAAEREREDDDDDEGLDLAALKPEDPELVASAIREIVGLLT